MWASYIKAKSGEPEIGKGSPLFFRPLAVCVFRPAIPQRSYPYVALSALPDEVSNIMSFPISGAKVLLFFETTKFLSKKNASLRLL